MTEREWHYAYQFPPNNIVDLTSDFGENVKMGHFCVIEDGVTVGDNVEIGNYVLLKKGTVIGDNCFIDSYARSSGDNVIGNNVTIRFGATIARNVEIQDDVFISPNVMTIYKKYTGDESKKTLIKQGAFIGTAANIGPNVMVEEGVIVGAQAFVSKDCKIKNAIYTGVPAEYKKMKKGY